jgi:hypothetical protein
VRSGVAVVPLAGQLGAAHCVPGGYSAQPPCPSQKPVCWQLAAPRSAQAPVGSPPPAATGRQAPVAQVMHEPAQALGQQTPRAQKVLAHSGPCAHAAPGGLRPHEPALQVAGGAQSASAVQLVLHTAAPHANGRHEVVPGVRHAPAPSHTAAGVNVVVTQVESLQRVPAAYFWQAPASHLPLVPQLACPWSAQLPAGSDAPVATLVHVPIELGSAQDRHGPAQADAQHTPCAQTPDAHSSPPEQNAPFISGPHELPSHTLGATQFALLLQAVKQRVPLHANGAQARASGWTQAPVPLQVAAGRKTFASQVSGAQMVSARYLRQPPPPSQAPSVPQLAAP